MTVTIPGRYGTIYNVAYLDIYGQPVLLTPSTVPVFPQCIHTHYKCIHINPHRYNLFTVSIRLSSTLFINDRNYCVMLYIYYNRYELFVRVRWCRGQLPSICTNVQTTVNSKVVCWHTCNYCINKPHLGFHSMHFMYQKPINNNGMLKRTIWNGVL